MYPFPMKKAAKALLFTLPLLALDARADANADLLRAFKNAKQWDDVLAQLKGVLPTNVQEEFKLAVKDQPFPTIRVSKEGLLLIQSDGSKMALKFGKDGTAYVNGKEWRLKPLATVDAEVKRLGEQAAGETKSKRASVFSLLMPSAVAGPAFSAGAAAVASATSARWRAEACKGEELTDGLDHDCPQMAVGMLPIVKVAESKPAPKNDEAKLFKPVSLKCPADNRGVYEIQAKNKEERVTRVRITFANGNPTSIVTAAYNKQVGKFVEYENYKLPLKDEDDQYMAEVILKQNKSVYEGVCNAAPDVKRRYMASLDSNRKELAMLVPSDSNDGSGEMRPAHEIR